jgi:hypothetical protein
MARGDKAESISNSKAEARKAQRRLQNGGLSKRNAENRAWDAVNRTGRATRASGTAGGRSKVSKRTTMRPQGSTRKTKTAGKTRR